ncbi:AMP-binding protein [Kribbella sp. NBC_00709]|uniref:class I adenylate-forming enzyme family protein n=1 Tax=Kribbella sp. NBC_00709 TaxID=2975972 RepID=UPI002E2AE82C|nr:AMP-binding protein [Kribbella sp. NBC_00709]
MAVIDFFDRGWRLAPTAVAYRSESEAWTYEQAGRLSCRIAHGLLSAGVVRETKVAVLAPNAPLAWICVLGIWRAGGAWVPVNPNHPIEETAGLLRRFDVELLFYDTSLSDQVDVLRERLENVVFIALGHGTEDFDFGSWIAQFPDTRPDVSSAMDDVVAIAPTGGTTGTPKGVMNTHRTLSAMVAHQLLALSYPDGADIVNLAAAPMTHTAGLLSLQTTARGGTVVIVPRAAPGHILSAIENFGVTEVFLPPTVIYRLLDVLEQCETDTSSLRYLIYGAAPMSVEKLRRGIARLGPVFIEGYGQMEAPAAISFLRPNEHLDVSGLLNECRLSSCGRPYPLVTVEVRDPVTGQQLAPYETGEICVRGDLVMKGYYQDPERTAEVIRDGWLHTGDLGHLDPDGYLYLTGRLKDLIITGGFNVYPSEVEQIIWGHPAVEDCAVVGAPDNDWGERVTAVVELKPGLGVTADELKLRCREALGSVRAPKDVVFVDRLPRSVNGKVLKKDVRATFWAGHDRTI